MAKEININIDIKELYKIAKDSTTIDCNSIDEEFIKSLQSCQSRE